MSTETPAPKISDVEVRNYMRVRHARLTLDGNTFVIAGDNGQGKSSFVQAIEDAFGGSKFAPSMPIRKGASEAVVLITLSDGTGRVLKAEIVHSKTGRRLTVKDADGKTQSSPQSIMDAFWAETSFDPSLFLVSTKAQQVDMLKRLGGLDFAKLDAERAEKFTLRTSVGREADRLATVAAAKPSHPDAPKAEVSSAKIVDQIQQANEHNAKAQPLYSAISEARMACDVAKREIDATTVGIGEIEAEIAQLQKKLTARRGALESLNGNYGTLKTQLEDAARMHTAFKPIDVGPLQAELGALEGKNKQVRANAEKAKAVEDSRSKRAEYDGLTRRIEAIDEEKSEMVRNAKFPIDGLSIDGDDVTIGGIPLSQESDSRKLAIGVEMAAVMNPGKPLMLVRHGNLFTPENFPILEAIAAKRNLTCIVEIPGKKVAGAKLVFEDGVGIEPTAAQQELPAS